MHNWPNIDISVLSCTVWTYRYQKSCIQPCHGHFTAMPKRPKVCRFFFFFLFFVALWITDLDRILHVCRYHRRSCPHKFWWPSVKGALGSRESNFPLPDDFHRRSYNTLALPYERVTVQGQKVKGQGHQVTWHISRQKCYNSAVDGHINFRVRIFNGNQRETLYLINQEQIVF